MTIRLREVPERVFSYAVMLFTVGVSIFPILWLIVSSFKTNKEILGNPFALPKKIDFQVYADVITQYDFLTYFKNSVLISVAATLIAVFIYSLAAYIFGKFDFWGKNFLFIVCTITLLVPGYSRIVPIFQLISILDLYNTRLALIIVYASFGLALALFILRLTFASISKEFDEAAIIDGAGFWRIFWSINLPLARSGMATAGVLMFLTSWNEYFYAVILTSDQSIRTLPVAVSFFNEAFSYNYPRLFAALVMVILPGIAVYLLVQEQVQNSVASAGVKG